MINRTDLKIFKPQLLGNVPEAGGQRTPVAVVSGKVQELFTPVSDIDHAQSAINIVKCYPTVSTPGTEKLVGAHAFVNVPPTDPKVSVIMVESDMLNDGSLMTDMIDILESAVNPGQLIQNAGPGFLQYQDTFPVSFLTTSGVSGAQATTASIAVGQTICISVEYTGAESSEWPRKVHYCKVVDIGNSGSKNVIFTPPISFATPGPSVQINTQTNCTKIRYVTEANALNYHGVSKLTTAAAQNSTVLGVVDTQQEIVPSVDTGTDYYGLRPGPEGTQLVYKFASLPVGAATTYNFPLTDRLLPSATNNAVNYNPLCYFVDTNNNLRVFNPPASVTASDVVVSLPAKAKAGSVVMLAYLSTAQFENVSHASTTKTDIIKGTVSASASYQSAQRALTEFDDGFYYRDVSGWMLAAVMNYETGELVSASGLFTNLQYNALRWKGVTGNVTNYNMTIVANNARADTLVIRARTEAGTLVTAATDSTGSISGAGVSGSFANNYAQLTFTASINPRTITYDVQEQKTSLPPADVFDIDPLRMPNNGVVDIFRQWGVVAIQHSAYQSVTSPAAGQVKTVRPGARFVDITDANNASLWTPTNTHFTADLVAGTVTIHSNFSGFTAPFVLTDTIGELALVSNVNHQAKQLQIATGLTREYPVNSTVASVLKFGDLQAYVGPVRDMVSWGGNWDNDDNNPAFANLNVTTYPIQVVNNSCINEDWALIFVTTTLFRLVGRNVGQVATGDTLNDFAPINPIFNQPYFVIRKEAFGGGWNPGEVVRFKTFAAGKPVMLVRVVKSGHSQIDSDRIVLSFRGNEE